MQNRLDAFPVFSSRPNTGNYWIRDVDFERVRCLSPHYNGEVVDIYATVLKHRNFIFDGLDNITDRDFLLNRIVPMQFSLPSLPPSRGRNAEATTVIKPP